MVRVLYVKSEMKWNVFMKYDGLQRKFLHSKLPLVFYPTSKVFYPLFVQFLSKSSECNVFILEVIFDQFCILAVIVGVTKSEFDREISIRNDVLNFGPML